MWRAPGRRALRFEAVERFAVERVAFRWDAKFPLAPLLALKVTDVYDGESGRLRVGALGLPLQRSSGHDVAISEAYRYLAELVWVPDAILVNEELEWRTIDARQVEVSTRVGDELAAVTLVFDSTGDVERCCADGRPRLVNGKSVPTAWGGKLGDYRERAGRRLPSHAEVYWDLPDGRFVYWEAEVTGAEPLAEPFGT